MRTFLQLLLPVLLTLIFIVSCASATNSTAENGIQQQRQATKLKIVQLIIKFRNADFDPSQGDYLQKLSRDIGATLAYLRPMSGGAHVLSLGDVADPAQTVILIRLISQRPEVLYVEQDIIMKHQFDK